MLARVLVDLGPVRTRRRRAGGRHLATLSSPVLTDQDRQLVEDRVGRPYRTRVRRRPGGVTEPAAWTGVPVAGVPTRGRAARLTTAELRVLRLLPTHLTLSEIAEALFITRNTVKSQVASIYGKLLASNRAEAVQGAQALGLLANVGRYELIGRCPENGGGGLVDRRRGTLYG